MEDDKKVWQQLAKNSKWDPQEAEIWRTTFSDTNYLETCNNIYHLQEIRPKDLKKAMKWRECFADPAKASQWEGSFDIPKEAAQWAKHFKNPQEAYQWSKFSKFPQEAAGLKEHFKNPKDAFTWVKLANNNLQVANVASVSFSDPKEAQQWIAQFKNPKVAIDAKKSFSDLPEAQKWIPHFKDPMAAIQWRESFSDLNEAQEWSKHFEDPVKAAEWKIQGVKDVEFASKEQKIADKASLFYAVNHFHEGLPPNGFENLWVGDVTDEEQAKKLDNIQEILVYHPERDTNLVKAMKEVQNMEAKSVDEKIFKIAYKVDLMAGPRKAKQPFMGEYWGQKAKEKPRILLGNAKMGSCRHRAFLFHALAVAAGLNVTLVAGRFNGSTGSGPHVWNEVMTPSRRRILVDCMNPPFDFEQKDADNRFHETQQIIKSIYQDLKGNNYYNNNGKPKSVKRK